MPTFSFTIGTLKMVDKNTSNKPSQSLDLNCTAKAARFLKRVERKEKVGRIARRLGMIIVLLNCKSVFVWAASQCNCDRRTV